MENSNYENKNIETIYLNNMGKNQYLKVKNSLLELEKFFRELKDKKLKDTEIEIKKKIEVLLFKTFIVPIDNMDKFDVKKKLKT